MDQQNPSVDHSIWRYYQDGGKGFAARRAERLRSSSSPTSCAEKEILARAIGAVKREKTSDAAVPRRGKTRPSDDKALDRARQTLLGMILKEPTDGGHPSIPIDENVFKAEVGKMSPETLGKMAGFFSTIQAKTGTSSPSPQNPLLRSLDEELAKRGISLQLSGKVNNVYLSGANSSWSVNASAGAESDSDKRTYDGKGAARNGRYNNFGQTLGRAAKNFILGH